MSSYDELLPIAHEAVDIARDMCLTHSPGRLTAKGDRDMASDLDYAIERKLAAFLREKTPEIGFLGEEDGGRGAPGELTWTLDPIDGTVNYLYGFPWYAVSLAVQVDGVSVVGAVVEPASGRRWVAARGLGAQLDGETLRVSSTTRLDLALVATGFAYRVERRRRQAEGVAQLVGKVRDIRRSGAASLDLCAVAAGWLDGYFEHGLSRWDWAAGALIAEEAGAAVRLPGETDTDGLGADLLMAASPGVVAELTAALIECGLGKI
ncbi:MAG TPA: inositol monophosphatase [Micromonosporaceae bacterium]|nr:inositol monophosphatase [Micromonosporaceae bacterium]